MSHHGLTTYLTAKTILSDFRSGSSLPVLVETENGTKCVVKWKGTGEGPLSNAVDWICLHLGRASGILVPSPFLVKIEADLVRKNQDPDINDLVSRSLGMNLGLEYIPDALPYKAAIAEQCESTAKDMIYLFDVLIMNIDRTDLNPNMLVSDRKLYCIDFSNAIGVKKLMTGTEHSENALLTLIRRHPFYKKREDLAIPTFTADMYETTSSMPDEWLGNPGPTKKNIASGLIELLTNSQSILEQRLSTLDTLSIETPEEIKARAMRNRKAFEEKWGKL